MLDADEAREASHRVAVPVLSGRSQLLYGGRWTQVFSRSGQPCQSYCDCGRSTFLHACRQPRAQSSAAAAERLQCPQSHLVASATGTTFWTR
jgi:hypothetical protein